MIKELQEIRCAYCNQTGLSLRQKVRECFVLTENNELKEQVFWECICKYCDKINKILWNEA